MTTKSQHYYAKNLRLYLQEPSRNQKNKGVNLFISCNNENYKDLVTDHGRRAVYSR